MTLIYMAQPIDLRRTHPTTLATAASQIESELLAAGATLFYPHRAWGTRTPDHRIQAVNTRILCGDAGGMVALMPEPSMGVSAEIEKALLFDIPVVLVVSRRVWEASSQVRFWCQNPLVHVLEDPTEIGQSTIKHLLEHPAPLQARPNELLAVAPSPERLPWKAYGDDAGWDLSISVDTVVHPGEMTSIPTEISVATPPGHWGLILGRSSTLRKHLLQVQPGVIDPGWRGPLEVVVFSLNPGKVELTAGSRIAQLIPLPVWDGPVVPVQRLPEHQRGENGWGSSGQ